jgi:hypothetical protein
MLAKYPWNFGKMKRCIHVEIKSRTGNGFDRQPRKAENPDSARGLCDFGGRKLQTFNYFVDSCLKPNSYSYCSRPLGMRQWDTDVCSLLMCGHYLKYNCTVPVFWHAASVAGGARDIEYERKKSSWGGGRYQLKPNQNLLACVPCTPELSKL